MAFQIVFHVTPEGLQLPEIQASSEAEEKEAEEILNRIRPGLDVVTAILKKGSAGPRG